MLRRWPVARRWAAREWWATPGTVGGILGELRVAHPGLYDRLVTEQGLLRPHVNIFVDGENIRFTGGLETAVAAGSEVLVLPAISGG